MMYSLADFDFNQVTLPEAIIQVSQHFRDDFPAQKVRQQLAELAEKARQQINEPYSDKRLARLLELFYGEWGFRAIAGIYRLSDAMQIDWVLETRTGSAMSLGGILLSLTDSLNIPLMPVIFPTQLILRGDWMDGEMWLIDPFNGATLSQHTLEVWLKGTVNPFAVPDITIPAETCNKDVIFNMLRIIKLSLAEEGQTEKALRVSETLLQINPKDMYEIRDRGLLYAQLECVNAALCDLNYFVTQCPGEAGNETLRRQINELSQQRVILH